MDSSPLAEVDPSIVTPETAYALTWIGSNIRFQLQYLLPHLIMYGLYLAIVMAAVYTIAKRPTYSARTFWLFGALIVTLCITTFSWVYLYVIGLQLYIEKLLVENTSLSIYDREASMFSDTTLSTRRYLVSTWVAGYVVDSGVVFIISDILVSWRALAIWGPRKHRKSLRMMLWILVFLSFSFWVIHASINTDMILKGTYGVISSNVGIDSIFLISSSSSSIGANLVATGMMGYVTWKNLRESTSDSRLKGTRVLLYFTESGLFYAVIQVIRLGQALAIVPSTPTFGSLATAHTVFCGLTDIMVAMYTPAIILIIHYQLSIENTIQFSTNTLVPRGGGQSVSAIHFQQNGGHGTQNTGFSRTQDYPIPEVQRYATSNSTTGSLLQTADVMSEKREDDEKAIGRVA